jgi:hypothetical protein
LTGSDALLNSSAGSAGICVGRGVHSSHLYTAVGLAPSQGNAFDMLKAAESRSMIEDEGIAKRLTAMAKDIGHPRVLEMSIK